MIKFRARCLDGKIHCGDLLHSFCDGKDVYEIRECTFYKNSAMTSYQRYHTARSEVAHFVGYDKNGAEIYSDDKIRIQDWTHYYLTGTGIEVAGDFVKVNDIGKKFENVEVIKDD